MKAYMCHILHEDIGLGKNNRNFPAFINERGTAVRILFYKIRTFGEIMHHYFISKKNNIFVAHLELDYFCYKTILGFLPFVT